MISGRLPGNESALSVGSRAGILVFSHIISDLKNAKEDGFIEGEAENFSTDLSCEIFSEDQPVM